LVNFYPSLKSGYFFTAALKIITVLQLSVKFGKYHSFSRECLTRMINCPLQKQHTAWSKFVQSGTLYV